MKCERGCGKVSSSIQKTYYKAIYENNTSFLSKGAKPGNSPSVMNVMMELRKCCNQLFLIRLADEWISADAAASGPHKSEQAKSDILSKVLFLMETPLQILTGLQSPQNNLLSPQERFFWQSFYKSCRAVGTRYSFSVRWFVYLNFSRICCASDSPNMKGLMNRSPPHIRPVLLIDFATYHIKGLSWYWEQEQERWGLTYLQ